MNSKNIFIIYVFSSIIMAWYSVAFCNCNSLFGYSESVSIDILRISSLYLLCGLGFFLLGSFLFKFFSAEAKLNVEIDSKNLIYAKVNSPKWHIRIVLFVFLMYVFMFIYNLEAYGLPEDLTGRVFENKFSSIILLMLSFIGFETSGYKKKSVLYAMIIAVSIMVTIIDASRSGLIPLVGILLGALNRRKIFLSLLILYLIYFGVGYSIGARLYDNRFDFEVIYSFAIPDIELVSETISFALDYVVSFSVLNFTYMAFILEPSFSLNEVLISINPVPSFLFADDAMDSLKLTGDVRAIGSPAELFIAGKFYFFMGFFVIGILSRYVDKSLEHKYKFIILLIFSLSIIIFFQYSLRTYSRFFQLIFLVALITKWKIKKG